MPNPPARLRTPREGMQKKQAEMRELMNDLKEEYLEPLLSRFPRLLPNKTDAAARYALYSAVAWFALWMLMAAVTAIQVVFPEFLHQFSFVSYGRLRQAEQHVLSWGVLFTGSVGAAFAIVPRVCKTRLWSERIGAQIVVGLSQVVVAGTLLLLIGRTQGTEGLEWPWPIDIAIVLVMLGVLQVLMFTVMRRNERRLNTPAKCFIAAFHVLPITYALSNFLAPYVYGVKQTYYSGFGTAGFLTAMSLVGAGATMFVLPRATRRPLWSDTVANTTFWMMLFVLPWLGLAMRVLGPTQDWAETLGITFAITALVPAAFLITLAISTIRGGAKDDPSVVFMVGASVIWSLGVLLNLIVVLRHSAAIVGTTWWNEAVRTAFYGAFGLWLVGLTYHLIPRIRGRALRSPSLVRAHFWVGALGIGLATLALAVAGVAQGYVLRAGAAAGARFATGDRWIEVTAAVRPMLIARLAAGGLVFVGIILLLVNVQQTLAEGSETEAEVFVPEPVGSNA